MVTETLTTFGAMLRRHRLAAGLTQEQLAERAGLSVYGIQKLERGTTQPYRDTAARLMAALALTLDEADQFRAAIEPVRRRARSQLETPGDERHRSLPIALTSFVGREHEMDEIRSILSNVRLLTLVGTGGVGKTRLALAIAAESQPAYTHGICVVELAALADESLVAHTVLTALGARELPDQEPLAALVGLLRSRRLLLVLDNCEHVLGACEKLASAVLQSCPGIRILATSREHLGLIGETVWRVPSLSVPDAHGPSTIDSLKQYASVQLFEQRARLGNPSLRSPQTTRQR